MNSERIRPLALCIFRRDDRIFLSGGYDPIKNEYFYRPIGGGIEFGEYGRDAIAREVREELGTEIQNVRPLGSLESIFTYNGNPGHELVMLYEADFADPKFYDLEREHSIMEGGEAVASAMWKPYAAFVSQELKIYPEGILGLIP